MFEVSGDLNIYDMLSMMDLSENLLDSDYSTVSGWALEELEHIPQEGESFVSKGLKVTVLEVEDQRILRLLVEQLPEDEEENDD